MRRRSNADLEANINSEIFKYKTLPTTKSPRVHPPVPSCHIDSSPCELCNHFMAASGTPNDGLVTTPMHISVHILNLQLTSESLQLLCLWTGGAQWTYNAYVNKVKALCKEKPDQNITIEDL